MLNPWVIIGLLVSALGIYNYIGGLQDDVEAHKSKIKEVNEENVDLKADLNKKQKELELALKNAETERIALENMVSNQKEETKRLSEEAASLRKKMENVSNEKVKECFDTDLPDDIYDGLFGETRTGSQGGDQGSSGESTGTAQGGATTECESCTGEPINREGNSGS